MSGINNTWVCHCHVIENCATTDHEISLDFSSLGRQKNRPFQFTFEDADWLNFMSHLEYIYFLNQDLTKFYKDLHPVGDFSIAPQLKLRRADRQRVHIVIWNICDMMVKTYIFHRRFSIISHHTNVHLNNLIIILCVWFREGGALAPYIGQPPLVPVLLWPDEPAVCSNCSKVKIVRSKLVPEVFSRWLSRWRGSHWGSVSGAHLGVHWSSGL